MNNFEKSERSDVIGGFQLWISNTPSPFNIRSLFQAVHVQEQSWAGNAGGARPQGVLQWNQERTHENHLQVKNI